MRIRHLPLVALGFALAAPAYAIGTAFTYQGTLEDSGVPANGTYDLQFKVTSAAGTQVGPTLLAADVLVSAGVFTVELDFGAAVFNGVDRQLEIGVRPGPSSGSYQLLAPRTPLHPAPYAQRATAAATADLADDVIDNAIDEVDVNTGAISARTIATGAVGSAEIADGTVGNADVANDLTLSNFAGVAGNGTLSVTVAANDCNDYDVGVTGDVVAGDFPFVVIQAGFQLPDSMSITALRVPADDTFELRICNEADVQQSFSNLGVKFMTLR